MEIEIKPEDLSLFLEKIGPNNINRIEVFGINEDGSREKIDLSEYSSAQKKNLPSLEGRLFYTVSLSSYSIVVFKCFCHYFFPKIRLPISAQTFKYSFKASVSN